MNKMRLHWTVQRDILKYGYAVIQYNYKYDMWFTTNKSGGQFLYAKDLRNYCSSGGQLEFYTRGDKIGWCYLVIDYII